MTRLLVITPFFSTHGGGVEIVARNVIESLAKSTAFSLEWIASDGDRLPDVAGVTLTSLKVINWTEKRFGIPYPLPRFSAFFVLVRALRQCDVVHLHDCQYPVSFVVAFLARILRRPLIVTQHVGEIPYRSAWLRLILQLINRVSLFVVLRSARYVAFVSPHVQHYFEGLGLPTSHLVENGVDSAFFRPSTEGAEHGGEHSADGPLIAFVGRFVEKKGLHIVKRIAEERPAWRFCLAGGGPIDPSGWRLPNVDVLGRLDQKELLALYRRADLMLLPSTGEGFPLVVQESLATGCPVAVSDEVMRAGRLDPFIALSGPRENDDVGEWCARLDHWFSKTLGQRGARREAAAALARDWWSWQKCVAQYVSMISSLSSDDR